MYIKKLFLYWLIYGIVMIIIVSIADVLGIGGKYFASLVAFCASIILFTLRYVMRNLREDFKNLCEKRNKQSLFGESQYQMDLAMKMYDSYYNVIGLIISFGLFILALGMLIFSK